MNVIEEKDVVNKLVKTRRLIQEQDIETIPREVIKLKVDEVRPYLDEDALAAMLRFSTLFVDSVCMCVCLSCCRTFTNDKINLI
jgi:restriction endonuclease Mrr